MSPKIAVRFTIGADTFRHSALSAAEEFHCVRRVGPVVKNTGAFVTALAAEGKEAEGVERVAGVIEGGAPLLQALADLPEPDADYVIARCLGVTEMLDGEAWRPTWDPETQAPALPDLRMIHVLRICYAVLRDAITVFFFRRAVEFDRAGSSAPSYDPVRLPNDLDWLLWPVMADPPMCTYRELHDGTLRLADVVQMIDALAARDENRRRAHKAASDEARAQAQAAQGR